jgi:predicted PurR-regulated permease PerM
MLPEREENYSFSRRVLTAVAIIIAILILLVILYFALDVVLLLFGAVLLAIFLHGLAMLVRRFVPLSEGVSVLIVSLLLVGALALGVWALAGSVSEQITRLRADLPVAVRSLTEQLSVFGWGKAVLEQLPTTDEILEIINTSSFLTRVGGYFSSTVGAVTKFALLILLAVYLASEPRTYIRGFTKLFPIARRTRVLEILASIGETLSWWLIGKGASMLVIAVLTWIGLSVIGVRLALTLGLIAGLLSFIPNFGPILSAVPAVLLAFVDSPQKALYVAGLYVAVQLIESNVITPFIERETVELPPALTIVAQLALGVLLGGLGLVLATPLLAVIMVLVQMVYVEDVLGDSNTDANEVEEDIKAENLDEEIGKPKE